MRIRDERNIRDYAVELSWFEDFMVDYWLKGKSYGTNGL